MKVRSMQHVPLNELPAFTQNITLTRRACCPSFRNLRPKESCLSSRKKSLPGNCYKACPYPRLSMSAETKAHLTSSCNLIFPLINSIFTLNVTYLSIFSLLITTMPMVVTGSVLSLRLLSPLQVLSMEWFF